MPRTQGSTRAVPRRKKPAGTGLSLSDLSEKMGLAHSTVSEIVGRLERDGVLRRTTRPEDRRYA
jgi:DNA-binding MarR family transcriptional regulator